MKKIVICCDGTWNRADQERNGVPCPTNVVKLAYRVAKRDEHGTSQVIYYDQGVGTGNALDRFSGGAFGQGLEENIYGAYRFLVANYEEGDEIYLFGFSRGAFTARSLAGMIRNCGVLRRESVRHYTEALRLYRDGERRPSHPDSVAFRTRHSICKGLDIEIEFIGVWDTVGALGIPLRGLRSLTRRRHQFHDAELSGTVRNTYHALVIDEQRTPFEPTLWDYKPKDEQTVEQVWFCGVHSDVGGGYPDNGLSDIALDWMISKADAHGLCFDGPTMKINPLQPQPLGTLHNSKKGMYRLTRGIDRPIGTDPTQSVHPSVLARWDGDESYRPAGLREYLRRTGDPRGDA
jgi:uncharacterized protein (DUF2235 family)